MSTFPQATVSFLQFFSLAPEEKSALLDVGKGKDGFKKNSQGLQRISVSQ